MRDKALGFLAKAGQKAATRAAHVEAVACFEQALEALQSLPSSREMLERAVDLRFDLRHSCVPLRDYRRGLDHLREAEMAAGSIGDQARLGGGFVYRTPGLFLAGGCRRGVGGGPAALAGAGGPPR